MSALSGVFVSFVPSGVVVGGWRATWAAISSATSAGGVSAGMSVTG
ncbi:hypothetical protein ACFQQB_12405 [Nonomuraea rubra]